MELWDFYMQPAFCDFYKLLFDKYGRSKAGIACADPEFFLGSDGYFSLPGGPRHIFVFFYIVIFKKLNFTGGSGPL